MAGYNKGDSYEEIIFSLLKTRGLIVPDSNRGGAGNAPDIVFLHNLQANNLEVKLDLKADYGQKMLRWSNNIWSWCKEDDLMFSLYEEIGILDIIKRKEIIPNRYSIHQEELTVEHKKQDQKRFADTLEIGLHALYGFYESRNCYYIQVGGYGFYHLKEDILSLGTQQFDCKMQLRLRAKTIHSNPVYKYGFYAVLKVKGKPQKSLFDIEEKGGRVFPPLI